MLVSTLLSAQVDQDSTQAGDATRALQAAGQVLHHFARIFPVALGSSEVLYETCRGSCGLRDLTVHSPTLCLKQSVGPISSIPPLHKAWPDRTCLRGTDQSHSKLVLRSPPKSMMSTVNTQNGNPRPNSLRRLPALHGKMSKSSPPIYRVYVRSHTARIGLASLLKDRKGVVYNPRRTARCHLTLVYRMPESWATT